MSSYERAIQVRTRNERLIRDFENQITTGQRDKTGLCHWRFDGLGDRCMKFSTDMHHGYYGRSSVASSISDDAGRELAKTLGMLKSQIIKLTVERLKREIVEAAKDAKSEAERILATVETE